MDYINKQDDIFQLKIQDHNLLYNLKSLSNIDKFDEHKFLDDIFSPNYKEQDIQIQINSSTNKERYYLIYTQITKIYDLRLTNMKDIMLYIKENFQANEQLLKKLFFLIKKQKIFQKRIHAKNKKNIFNNYVQYKNIKTQQLQQNGLFEQSLEIKKKKRNRISAQNSRDRKKQYLRQIQRQNLMMKEKLNSINKNLNVDEKIFIKNLLSLGMTTYLKMQQKQTNNNSNNYIDDQQIQVTFNQFNIKQQIIINEALDKLQITINNYISNGQTSTQSQHINNQAKSKIKGKKHIKKTKITKK